MSVTTCTTVPASSRIAVTTRLCKEDASSEGPLQLPTNHPSVSRLLYIIFISSENGSGSPATFGRTHTRPLTSRPRCLACSRR